MRKLISIIIILFVSCSPVKQVLRDSEKFNKVAEEVVRRGYCVNDTTVIVETKDSIVYNESIIEIIERIPCADFDTTIGRARIKVSSGVLTYTAKDSIVYKKQTITNTVRDRAYEKILEKDITKLDSMLINRNVLVHDLRNANKELKSELRWWKWRMIMVVGLVIAIIVGKALLRGYLKKI